MIAEPAPMADPAEVGEDTFAGGALRLLHGLRDIHVAHEAESLAERDIAAARLGGRVAVELEAALERCHRRDPEHALGIVLPRPLDRARRGDPPPERREAVASRGRPPRPPGGPPWP